MKDFLQKGCLVVGAIVFAVFLVEGFAWLAPDKLLPPRLRDLRDQLDRDRKAESFLSPDPELIFKIKPNQNFLVKHPDYTMRVVTHLNLPDIGFRGGSLGGAPWAVAVGDSFTFGQGVDHDGIWTSLLAKSLGRDVINFGVPAQGPAQYTRILKRYALPMHPRLALYGFYFNDLDSAVRFRRIKRGIPVGRYLRENSVVYNLIHGVPQPAAQEQVFFKADGVEFSLDPDGLRRNLERQTEKFDDRWTAVSHEVDDGIKASAEAGVTFVLFYFPSRWEVYWDQINKQLEFPSKLDIDRLRRQVVEYCATKKILCLDLTAPLKRAASQNQQLYFRTDGHWNQEGHRVVAQAMRQFLTAAGVAR
jgi:hypothetical protein